MTRLLFIRKMVLPLLSVYLFCCPPALSQELATEDDFTGIDLTIVDRLSTSADGRYRAYFHYEVDDLNSIQSTTLALHDSVNNTNTLLNTEIIDTVGRRNPHISANGKFITFEAAVNDNRPPLLYRYDIDNGETILITDSSTSNSHVVDKRISPDGRFLTYIRGNISFDGTLYSFGDDTLYLFDSLDGNQSMVIDIDSCPTPSRKQIYGLGITDGYISYAYSCAGGRDWNLFLYDINNGVHTKITSGPFSLGAVTFSKNSRYVWFFKSEYAMGQIYDRFTGEIYRFGVSTECLDSDGDGWGFNEYLGASCNVEQLSESACDYSNADLYGGWGWNSTTSQSCAPLENVVNTEPTAQCIDSDGDGYGWDGTASCVPESTTPVTNPSANSNCDYSDAVLYGGWGWNATANQSCAPLETVVVTQPTAQCIDTDGDGWGWDGSGSCRP